METFVFFLRNMIIDFASLMSTLSLWLERAEQEEGQSVREFAIIRD